MKKIIPGFSQYAIYSNGTIKKLSTGNIIQHQNSQSIYPYVSIEQDKGGFTKKRVSFLVAEAYVLNPNNLGYVAFKDGNIRNLNASNLFWTSDDPKYKPAGFMQYAKSIAYGRSYIEITKMLNERFDLKFTSAQIQSYLKKNHICTGRDGRFKKGRAYTNSYKVYTHPNSIKTRFKKGNVPYNVAPIGTEVIRQDGLVWIKVHDKPGPHNVVKRWIQRSLKVWLENGRELKDNEVLIHLDGDSLNDDISNLTVATKNALLVANRKNLIYEDPELTLTGLDIAKTITLIQKHERKKKHGHKKQSDRCSQSSDGAAGKAER